ncbi:adenylylsulfate kinase-like kinase [Beggiatoa alba B18LD]|uniref:Adenylylsulfate kinase-like kinase n=1 Tax=Beggiatoa alba B18LD TaxID=395493 RepID=I3CDI9_9GAMM|nr:CHAT domain-containing protein [Beggiatoa alba]EIJ41682.1 adenylylsulfate kinase-like kinase [Beggiatoa alba B18LD]
MDVVTPQTLAVTTALLHQAFQQQAVTTERLQTMGEYLWQISRPLLLANHTPNQQIIGLNTQAYPSLYWELLHHPRLGFVAQHPDYTLYHQWVSTQIPPKHPLPLRILLFTIQLEKDVQSSLEVETEQQRIYTVLQPFIQQGIVQLQLPDDGRFSTLAQLLAQPWHLVILSGHAILTETADTQFLFEANTLTARKDIENPDAIEIVPAQQLLDVLKNATIECLVLATCHSASLAATLHPFIPHVIGMRDKVLDRASHIFLQVFCSCLLQVARVDMAVQKARIAMAQPLLTSSETWSNAHCKPIADPSCGQWSLPTLYSQNPLRPLLAPTTSAISLSVQTVTTPVLPFLIGRRQALRELMDLLQQQHHVWLTGTTGAGKTTIAQRLIWQLQQQGYVIITQLSTLPSHVTVPTLLYLDDLKRETLSIEQQQQINALPCACLLVSRRFFDSELISHHYPLSSPSFLDFSRYCRYLRLPHTSVQLRLIYHGLQGNFAAVQLFQNLPPTNNREQFQQQLQMAKRFLRGRGI